MLGRRSVDLGILSKHQSRFYNAEFLFKLPMFSFKFTVESL
jgi:hypothetical protein